MLQHWLVDRPDGSFIGAVWYDRLDLPNCVLASWSYRLDQKWETKVWTGA